MAQPEITAIPSPPRFDADTVPPYVTGVLVADLGALRRNYRALRAKAAPAEAAAVVKADAYGIGARMVVPALLREGCRTLFVATLGEAATVREAAPDAAIYVLDGLLPGSAAAFREHGLRPVLGSLAEIEEWAAFCKSEGASLPAAVHIDTGMTRLGLDMYAVERLAAEPRLLEDFQPALLMSHLACGDEPDHPKNEAQRSLFERLSTLLPPLPRSLANSAGVFLGAPYRFDLVRPGIALYGGRAQSDGPNPMEPVVWLYGRVAQVRWAKAGETVGYGAGHTLARRTRIATVTAGYADGYRRAASASDSRAGPFAKVAGKRLPMLGRVSMDLIMFDCTGLPDDAVQRGGYVELVGDDMTVDSLAAHANTIGYEILTSLGPRHHRVYTDSEG